MQYLSNTDTAEILFLTHVFVNTRKGIRWLIGGLIGMIAFKKVAKACIGEFKQKILALKHKSNIFAKLYTLISGAETKRRF